MITLMRVVMALALTYLLYLFMVPWFETMTEVGSVIAP